MVHEHVFLSSATDVGIGAVLYSMEHDRKGVVVDRQADGTYIVATVSDKWVQDQAGPERDPSGLDDYVIRAVEKPEEWYVIHPGNDDYVLVE